MHRSHTPTSDGHDRRAPPIAAKKVSLIYNGTVALEDISFETSSGQQVAIVGPNGAGKTTLFKLIAGTLKPTSGQIQVHGHYPGQHVCVAYVPQRSEVDWQFPVTVRDVVMMGRVRTIGLFRWPRQADWAIIHTALTRVGMQGLADRQIGELSGGEQQRVFLAQAFAQEAEVVLLDEPLSGLDVPSQKAVLHILDEFKEEGMTVLTATHDINLAAERFNQVILLNRRMIAYGPPETVFTEKNLREAYGGHLHIVAKGDELAVVVDHHHPPER